MSRVDLVDWDEYPDKWIAWGNRTYTKPWWTGTNWPPVSDYLLIRFPSYQIMPGDYGRHHRWHQLVFLCVGHGEFFDPSGRWHAGKSLRKFDWLPIGDTIKDSPGLGDGITHRRPR